MSLYFSDVWPLQVKNWLMRSSACIEELAWRALPKLAAHTAAKATIITAIPKFTVITTANKNAVLHTPSTCQDGFSHSEHHHASIMAKSPHLTEQSSFEDASKIG